MSCFNHQDFNVRNIGHGGQSKSADPFLQKRMDMRSGKTTSVRRPGDFTMASKQVVESTEAHPVEYCDGRVLTRLRNEKRLSQPLLARKVNLKPQIIAEMEKGKFVANPENKKIYSKVIQTLKKIRTLD
tara:strand:+ start:5631 stop:6017 length:387 start_codon:yes stop_codon:yes gene_type:complete